MQNGNLFERSGRFDTPFFQCYQGSFVDLLRKSRIHLKSLVFLNRLVQGFSSGTGKTAFFRFKLFLNRVDLQVDFDHARRLGRKVAEQHIAFGRQVGKLAFQLVGNARQALGQRLGRGQPVLVLEGNQGLPGFNRTLVQAFDLTAQKRDLLLGQIVPQLIDVALALGHQHLRDGVGHFGLEGLGANDQHP